MNINRIPTPALIVEADIFYKNLETMKGIFADKKVSLRPHYKSNKSSFIAHEQMKYGAKGITCAKLGEAIDLADSGIKDILIANQIVEESKINQVAQLALDCHLTVCVDNSDNVKALSKAAVNAGSTIHCYVEYDIGMDRCGVVNQDDVVALAREIKALDGLTFDGIQAYAGHISHVVGKDERLDMTSDNSAKLRQLLAKLEEAGIPARELSGGSTGTSLIKAEEGLYTEIQAGSYIFMDATYRDLALPFENSLFILATVVSTRGGVTVLDAGVKSCGMDQGNPVLVGMNAERIEANEEHIKLFGLDKELKIGDKVRLIPGHCCSTVNLYDKIYMVRNDQVTDRIIVTARGKSR